MAFPDGYDDFLDAPTIHLHRTDGTPTDAAPPGTPNIAAASDIVAGIAAAVENVEHVVGIPGETDPASHDARLVALLGQTVSLQTTLAAIAADIAAHEALSANVHGVIDMLDLATRESVDAISASLVGSVVLDPTEIISAGDERYFRYGIWRALKDLPANVPPQGTGNGSLMDQLLLVSRTQGFARGCTGGFGGTVVTIANDFDTGAGSLRQTILDHCTAKTADPTRKTWVIADKNYHGGVYRITPESLTQIAGFGAQDITIDMRGVDFTYTGGGLHGGPGIGVHPNTFVIGGWEYPDTDFANGNTTPANNIILSNMKFRYDAGGEDGDNGFYDVLTLLHWCYNIFLDHCEFTNADWETDGNLEVGYGATNIHSSWCIVGPHDKSEIIIDNVPPEAPLPPGISLANQGPYELFVDATSPGGRVISKISQDHCWKPHVADRSPYVKGFASWYHGWNIWADHFGFWTSNINDPTAAIYYGTDPTFGGNFPNTGGPFECGKGGQMLLHNCIATPYDGATGTAKTRAVFSKREGVFGFSKTSGMLYEGSCGNDGGDHLPDQVFVPPYAFAPDVADDTLKARLMAGAGAHNDLWEFVGPGLISATVGIEEDGVGLGPVDTPAPATGLNFAGNGLHVAFDDVTGIATVTVVAGQADPTTILLTGDTLPAPGPLFEAIRFELVYTRDSNGEPTNSQEFACRFYGEPNLWAWKPVAPALLAVPIPGIELGNVEFDPVSQQTNAQTTSLTLVDVTASGLAAAPPWVGANAASLDVAFATPTTRAVWAEFEMAVQSLTSKKMFFGFAVVVAGVATTIVGTQGLVSDTSAITRPRYRKRIDLSAAPLSLAAGADCVLRPQWCVLAGGTPTAYVGGTWGPAAMRVSVAS